MSPVPALLALIVLSPDPDQAEVTTRDTEPTFQVRSNLVLVPVVVRDAKGNAVATLAREDFFLTDKGKPQIISKFSVEKTAGPAADHTAAPERFAAFVFDDNHLPFADLALAKQAAERYVTGSNDALDRIAIFSASANVTQEFTDNRDDLKSALERLKPSPSLPSTALSYEVADQIANRNDTEALEAATQRVLRETGMISLVSGREGQAIVEQARGMVRQEAQRALLRGREQTRGSLAFLHRTVRRMAILPGRRTLVFVSNGFYAVYERRQLDEVIDAAARASVVLHVLDPGGVDAALSSTERDTLSFLAGGTNGKVFSRNDLELGFKRAAGAPAVRYILGFTPANLKSDGSLHELKVTLRNAKGLDVQARRGYYAPNAGADPAQAAKQEIEDALFSREEIRGVPTEVHTRFFKPSDDRARLSVVARIDVRNLPYRKQDGRNRDELTVISVLFDRHGNYVAGTQKAIEMRLRDQTLASAQGPPVAVKSNFDVKPGAYMIRVVVRDAEGQRMAAANSMVEIP